MECITQPDFTCSECKQVQSTRRAVTRNSFSVEGQAAPTPKAVVISCPSLSGLSLPAQHSLGERGDRSRPAPEGDHLPRPCYCKMPCLSSNLIPSGSPARFSAPTSAHPGWTTGRVCLVVCCQSLERSQRQVWVDHICVAADVLFVYSHQGVSLRKDKPTLSGSLHGNILYRGRAGEAPLAGPGRGNIWIGAL